MYVMNQRNTHAWDMSRECMGADGLITKSGS
jgi:hypothetical protein